MPELPEADTIARDLRDRVTDAVVATVHVLHRDVLAPDLPPRRLARRLRGRRISRIGRRGKNLLLRLEHPTDDPVLRLLVNLGMTGRLVVSDSPRAHELNHIAVRFDLEDGRSLLYDDTRRFGRMELHTPDSWERRDAELGIEPLSDDFTPAALHRLTSRSITPVRNWLLDQRRIAGIGNIYANEALFRAGIDPRRPARSLSLDEAAALHDALRTVLADAIRARGTTFSDYRDGSGEAGAYEPLLRVYGRAGEPCQRCGATLERVVLSNRSAFLCPGCQG